MNTKKYLTFTDYLNHIKVCEFLNKKPVHPYDKVHHLITTFLPSLKIKQDEFFNHKLLFHDDKDIYLKMDVSGDYLIIMSTFDRHIDIPEIPWVTRIDFHKELMEYYLSMKFATATITQLAEDIYNG